MQIPGLHVDGAGAGKTTHQTLATLHASEDTPSSLLHLVLTVPGDQVTVVHNVLLALLELSISISG